MNPLVIEPTPSLKVKRLSLNAQLPVKAHVGDLGYDLFALWRTVIMPGEVAIISTGVACEFPIGIGGLIRDRSSMATRERLFVVGGVIDQGYTGEVGVALYNPTSQERIVSPGQKIAQMILIPVITFPVQEVESLQQTNRGSDGYGSTGR